MNLFESLVCFFEFLRKSPSTTKVLLTSRPQAEVKEILGRLPSVEHDKERKGLIALFLSLLLLIGGKPGSGTSTLMKCF